MAGAGGGVAGAGGALVLTAAVALVVGSGPVAVAHVSVHADDAEAGGGRSGALDGRIDFFGQMRIDEWAFLNRT